MASNLAALRLKKIGDGRCPQRRQRWLINSDDGELRLRRIAAAMREEDRRRAEPSSLPTVTTEYRSEGRENEIGNRGSSCAKDSSRAAVQRDGGVGIRCANGNGGEICWTPVTEAAVRRRDREERWDSSREFIGDGVTSQLEEGNERGSVVLGKKEKESSDCVDFNLGLC